LGAGRRDLELEGDTEFPWFRWNWELEEGVRRMDPTPGSVWLRLCGGQTGREGNGSFEGVLGSQRRQYLCRSEMRPTGEGNPKVNGMGEEEEYQTCRRSRKLQILLGPTDTHTHTHTHTPSQGTLAHDRRQASWGGHSERSPQYISPGQRPGQSSTQRVNPGHSSQPITGATGKLQPCSRPLPERSGVGTKGSNGALRPTEPAHPRHH
jgi:hypothetical protein